VIPSIATGSSNSKLHFLKELYSMNNEHNMRFLAKIQKQFGGCWLWMGGKSSNGYGSISTSKGQFLAHRYSWAYYNNQKPPSGMVVMHKCDAKECVNPDHLQIGTQKENLHDMISKGRDYRGNGGGKHYREKTHCLNGHAFVDENIYRPKGTTHRRCRICQRARIKAFKLKQKESQHQY